MQMKQNITRTTILFVAPQQNHPSNVRKRTDLKPKLSF